MFLPQENLRNKHITRPAHGLMPLYRFCLNLATGKSLKMTATLLRKVTAASAVPERFWKVIFPKKWKREYRKHATPLSLRSPQHLKLGFFFTATPH